MDALVALPGVGRKTANVVLGHALGVPGLPVDRHVLRVSNRIGIARSDDPEVVETQLSDGDAAGGVDARRRTRSSCTAGGSASRSRCAKGAPSPRTATTSGW